MRLRLIAFALFVFLAVAWHYLLVRTDSAASVPPAATVPKPLRNPAAVSTHSRSQRDDQWSSENAWVIVLDKTQDDLKNLGLCLQTQKCHFPNQTVADYQTAINKRAAALIDRLRVLVQKEHIHSRQITRFGRQTQTWADQKVRESGRRLLATQVKFTNKRAAKPMRNPRKSGSAQAGAAYQTRPQNQGGV